MKKIGITTFHNAHNYGAMLQAFALSKTLSKEYDVELVNYFSHKIYDQYKIIRPLCKNPFRFVKRFAADIFYLKSRKSRYMNFNDFINSNCKLSNIVYSKNELSDVNYDILITGSDQVWNPNIVGELSDIFTLNFGDDNIKRISYAASIGNAKTVLENSSVYMNKLSIIDKISVREEDAKEALDKVLNKSVDVVLDPTLLLTQEQWNSYLPKFEEKNEYILAYVVEPDEEYIKIVNELSEKENLKVIHFGIKNPGYKNVLKTLYSKGPLDFVNYIKHAKYVICTSFHATVFSIVFHKDFFVIPHRITGGRVTNLLDKLGIENRVVYSLNEFKNIDYRFQSDWEKVEKKLLSERKKSLKWLNDAIKD